MEDFVTTLAQLERTFTPTISKDEKVAKIWQLLERCSAPPSQLARITAGGNLPDQQHIRYLRVSNEVTRAISRHGLEDEWARKVLSCTEPDTHQRPPLLRLPCANHDPNTSRVSVCGNAGTRHCSACRLVGYCSESCQKQHWGLHKKDCKSPIRKADWQPDWVKESRPPSFISPSTTSGWDQQEMYGMNQTLWGNTPAIDILNVQSNEGNSAVSDRDLALAFVASGDLRHVVRSVNGLPKDYTGHLAIRINDREPYIVMRNVLILSVLGLVPGNNEAAEHALHIWYSVFLPTTYVRDVIPIVNTVISKLMTVDEPTIDLTSSSTLTVTATTNLRRVLGVFMSNGSLLDQGQANNAFTNVMNAPERVDYRHRYFAGLRPSHRLAMHEWRRFGIVLPFGAFNAHLNTPNQWLFGPCGRLFMNDSASPLEGWNIDDVIDSGKRCGATEEDIMGCLFFHVREQLANFAERLRRFHVSIHITSDDARELAKHLRGEAEASNIRGFDRIEVSNITDQEYIGVQGVLSSWGPLLNKDNKQAAIVGTFMNWVVHEPSARAESAGPRVASKLMKELVEAQFIDLKPSLLRKGTTANFEIMKLASSIDLKYENSSAFLGYLRKARADDAAEKSGLKRRQRNQIAPPRSFTSVGSRISALPDVETAEKWYRASALSGLTSYERYVEWIRA